MKSSAIWGGRICSSNRSSSLRTTSCRPRIRSLFCSRRTLKARSQSTTQPSKRLIVSRGLVDRLSASSIDQARVFAVKAVQSYQLNVNTSTLPQTLAQRGVDDTNRLPDYPYRDDALLIWGAIDRWVEDYVSHYYKSDAAVQGDAELQNWVAELVAHDGGRLNNVGEANRIRTRAQLVELVTLICFTASAQHAAVNYPQGATMAYTPAMPLAGYSPFSATQEGSGEGDFLKFLPPLEIAKLQLDILYLPGFGLLHETGRLRRRLLHRAGHPGSPGQIQARAARDRRGDQRAEQDAHAV